MNELKKKVIAAMDLLDLEVVSIADTYKDEHGDRLYYPGLIIIVTPPTKAS